MFEGSILLLDSIGCDGDHRLCWAPVDFFGFALITPGPVRTVLAIGWVPCGTTKTLHHDDLLEAKIPGATGSIQPYLLLSYSMYVDDSWLAGTVCRL